MFENDRSAARGEMYTRGIYVFKRDLCLEAMTGFAVPEGAIYYASSKRRRVVLIDAPLRSKVQQVMDAVRGACLSRNSLRRR